MKKKNKKKEELKIFNLKNIKSRAMPVFSQGYFGHKNITCKPHD